MSIDPKFVTTGFEFPGYRATKTLGVVRGIVVRSRSIIGTFGASLQTLLGGNITLYTQMCERARADAHQLMIDHAAQIAANAIIGVRYDAMKSPPVSLKCWPTGRRYMSKFLGANLDTARTACLIRISCDRIAKMDRTLFISACKRSTRQDK